MSLSDHASMTASDVSVSIITPCYNGGRFIAATIGSVLAQTRPALEVIVIDDGSTDDSAQIAESFGPPVRVIRQPNQGESVARNRGIAEARGSHLLFLDADDLLAPEALAHLATAVSGRPDAVAIMGCAWFRENPDEPYQTQTLEHDAFYPGILEANFGPPHCWLAPRATVQAAGGFEESMRWFEDWDLWWRVGLHATSLVPAKYVGAKYRQHAKSQLATTRPADRALGHATLVGRMVNDILGRSDVLAAHGDRLFWSAWAALKHAQRAGVPRNELTPLTSAIRRLAASDAAPLGGVATARLVRLFGTGVVSLIR